MTFGVLSRNQSVMSSVFKNEGLATQFGWLKKSDQSVRKVTDYTKPNGQVAHGDTTNSAILISGVACVIFLALFQLALVGGAIALVVIGAAQGNVAMLATGSSLLALTCLNAAALCCKRARK